MAPLISRAIEALQKRQYYNGGYYCDGYGYYYSGDGCYYSSWNAWGRWVLLAVIVVAAFLLFLLFSCITARRRRRAGRNPYPLTGWASRPGQYGNNQGYYNQGNNQGGYNAPPQYGGQQYGVSQPQAVYGNNRDINPGHYAPPAGAPPGKN